LTLVFAAVKRKNTQKFCYGYLNLSKDFTDGPNQMSKLTNNEFADDL